MRRTTAGVVLGACALVATACSSSDAGSATPSATATASSATASSTTASTTGAAATSAASSTPVAGKDYSALSLTAADFPTGYPLQKLDASTVAIAFDGLSGNNDYLKVTPPECASTNPFAGKDSLALVEAQNADTATTVDVFVGLAGSGGLGAVESTVGACPTVTVTSAGPNGSTASGQGTQAVLPKPTLDADATLAFSQDVTLKAPTGETLAQTGLVVAAQLGDTVVLVSGTAGNGQKPDTGLLDGLLAKAVDKVRAG